MSSYKKYKFENHFDESFEEPFDDNCCASTAYTLSPRDNNTSSHFDLDEDFKIHCEEEDEDYFNEKAYELAGDFLDGEGLFIVSPSPVLKSVRLNNSVSLKKMHALMFSDINNVPEGIEESINNFAIPSFMKRRKQIPNMRSLIV